MTFKLEQSLQTLLYKYLIFLKIIRENQLLLKNMENSIIVKQEEANKLNKILEGKDSQIRDFCEFSNKTDDPKCHFNINDLVF